jgi:uncharacterized protein YlxW (UPF0749 family)
MKISRNIAITLVCIILGIMIAWQYKSINYNQSVLSFQNKRTEELKDELIKLQNNNSELRTRLQQLIEENRAYENARAGDDEVTNNLKKQLGEARIFAGLTDVKGRGVVVTLDKNEFIGVEDVDILNVVNELRAAGAQAISINEERVVALTEVRQVGRYVVVNGVKLEAPFIIKAISDPDKLERALTMIGGVIESLENYQLNVSIKKSDDIVIPKVRDDGTVIKTDLLMPVK